jgi:hypothetical protein
MKKRVRISPYYAFSPCYYPGLQLFPIGYLFHFFSHLCIQAKRTVTLRTLILSPYPWFCWFTQGSYSGAVLATLSLLLDPEYGGSTSIRNVCSTRLCGLLLIPLWNFCIATDVNYRISYVGVFRDPLVCDIISQRDCLIFFFLVTWGGVRLSPLGTSATNWPIVPAPDDRWWVWTSRWNENW